MRGRKPKPTAVKFQSGNPGRRPLNDREPQHATIDPAVPAELIDNPVAAAEWARVIGTLGHGHVTVVDRATLIAYCVKWAQWRAFETAAAAEPVLRTSPNGHLAANPTIKLATVAFQSLLKAAIELGITPSSRARIIATPVAGGDHDVDEFTKFQRQRRQRA